MTDLVIHSDWDAEKATEHLKDLRDRAELAEHLHDALSNLADEHYRDASRIRQQIAHCEETFAAPKPPTIANGGTR